MTPAAFSDGIHYALMVLAVALLVGSTVTPPLVAQATARRRRRRGPGSFHGGEDRR